MKMKHILNGAVMLSVIGMIFLLNTTATAQNEIVRETRDLPAFDQIDAGGAFEVILTFGEAQKVEVESKQKDIGKILTEVRDNKLVISSKGISQFPTLNIYISVPTLTRLEAHGAADINGKNALKADMFSIDASGAASVELILDVNALRSEVSGAADVELTGKANQHSVVASGAATLDARNLEAITTDADVSGAATAKVNAEDVTGHTSGAGEIYSDDDGNVKTRHWKARKFNGHWAGVDIGFNGYVTPDFNMNFPKEFEYMDLRMEKSIATNLNFFEQNIALAKNQKWGLVTGLGLTFNDYRFMRPTRLSMDSSSLEGYRYDDISIRKSKLSAMYLTLPVLFEFQTAPAYHKNGFHINVGVLVSARLSSHTKVYYNELNKEYTLSEFIPTEDDPNVGQYEVMFTSTSPDDPKAHHYGDWFLQPFKFDATARIGWNFLNFWANYSLNTMFREGKGPELYPWSAGITLVCF